MRIFRLVFLILILAILISGCTKKSSNVSIEEEEDEIVTNVTIQEAKELINEKEDLVILDVRTKEEYDAGHIEGAIQIPVAELERRIDEIEDYMDNPILVYCRSGNRSSKAVSILLENDFNEIYHMNQGYMRWK